MAAKLRSPTQTISLARSASRETHTLWCLTLVHSVRSIVLFALAVLALQVIATVIIVVAVVSLVLALVAADLRQHAAAPPGRQQSPH